MTTAKGDHVCSYCQERRQNLEEDLVHDSLCPELNPELLDSPKLLSKWREGFDYGWHDNYYRWWEDRHPSPACSAFIMGYRVGKALIDEMINQAAEERASWEY